MCRHLLGVRSSLVTHLESGMSAVPRIFCTLVKKKNEIDKSVWDGCRGGLQVYSLGAIMSLMAVDGEVRYSLIL